MENHELGTSLAYISRPCMKKKRRGREAERREEKEEGEPPSPIIVTFLRVQ